MNLISRVWLKRRQDAARGMLDTKDVLDVGAGHSKIIPEAVGIDMKRLPGIAKVASAERLPFPDSSFRSVVMLEVIEHLHNPELALKEIRRVLKPGGQVVISTPNCTPAWEAVWAIWSNTIGKEWHHTHIQEFNPESLARLVGKYFKVSKIRTVNVWIIVIEGRKGKTG